jgi:type IV pilus assembly protein PilC
MSDFNPTDYGTTALITGVLDDGSVKGKRWVAYVQNDQGLKKKIKIISPTRSRARMQLTASGWLVTSITEAKSVMQIEFGNSVPKAVLLQFTRQLASFSGAGIPILQALSLLSESSKNKRMKATLISMMEDIRDGDTLPSAAAAHPNVFPEYYRAILEAAVRSGDMTSTFEVLANYLERELVAVRAVRSAMYYPAVLFGLALLAVIVLSTVVLPKFEAFFVSLNAELPWTTQALMNTSRFIGQWWWAIVGLIGLAVLAFWLIKKTTAGSYVIDNQKLKIPVFGKLLKFIALERFARILANLVTAGVPLADALKLCSQVMVNSAYERSILDARRQVIQGQGLATPLAQSGLFPQEAIQMFRVGEQTGQLSEQLTHSAKFYAGEVDYRLKTLSALIEPFILLVVGGGVGFLAVALVSAMYGIYSASSLAG